MNDEELLESLERHFSWFGNDWLDRAQFDAHASRGSCAQCEEITGGVAELAHVSRPLAPA